MWIMYKCKKCGQEQPFSYRCFICNALCKYFEIVSIPQKIDFICEISEKEIMNQNKD